MSRLTLFSTSGCHLCEQAHVLITQSLTESMSVTAPLLSVDIAEDPTLFERYGIRIPVLRNETSGKELDWPFTPEDIRKLL